MMLRSMMMALIGPADMYDCMRDFLQRGDV